MNKIKWLLLFVIFIYVSIVKGQYHEVSNTVVPFSFFIRNFPSYYRSITSIDVLADSLKSPLDKTRYCAAYRLAELKNPAAIPLLIKAYENEPVREFSIGLDNGLRDYALMAIGIIGGGEAEKYLCNLGNDIFFGNGISWAKGDAIPILRGTVDGLSMTGSACAESLLAKIIERYEKEGPINITLEIVYTARNRLLSLKDESQVKEISLLEELKAQAGILHSRHDTTFANENERVSFMIDNFKSHALQTNAIEIGIANPSILQEYKNRLAANDPFIDDIDYIIYIANRSRDNANGSN